jgi:hypothetical protein
MEAVGIFCVDMLKHSFARMGVSDTGVVSDGDVLSVCRYGDVWIPEPQRNFYVEVSSIKFETQ